MVIDPGLLEILVCPACRGALAPPDERGLTCRACGLTYPVRDGIPVMLVDEADGSQGESAPEPGDPDPSA